MVSSASANSVNLSIKPLALSIPVCVSSCCITPTTYVSSEAAISPFIASKNFSAFNAAASTLLVATEDIIGFFPAWSNAAISFAQTPLSN